MGLDLACHVLPAAPSMDFRPDGAQLASLLQGLQTAGWIGGARNTWKVLYDEQPGTLCRAAFAEGPLGPQCETLVARSPNLFIMLPGRPEEEVWPESPTRDDGESRRNDFELDPDGLFRPEYCDTIWLALSDRPWLFAMQQQEGAAITCVRCSGHLPYPQDPPEPGPYRWVAKMGFWVDLPIACPSCGADLGPHEVSFKWAPDGVGHELVGPFFRFRLFAKPPEKAFPEAPVSVDPSLLAAVEGATGVAMRQVVQVEWE